MRSKLHVVSQFEVCSRHLVLLRLLLGLARAHRAVDVALGPRFGDVLDRQCIHRVAAAQLGQQQFPSIQGSHRHARPASVTS